MPDEPVVKIEPTAAAVPEPVVAPVELVVAAPEPVPVPAPKKDWKDDRIAELTAKLNQARATKVEPPKTTDESDADFEARVNARAQVLADERVQTQTWNEKCAGVFTAGTAEYTDWKDKLGAVQSVVNAKDPNEVGQYNDVLAATIETGKAHQLVYQLGNDPGEFKRLMALTPVKRGMELATMAAKLDAAPEPSAAPAPITPIGSKGAAHEEITPDDPNRGMKLSTKEWMRRREAQAVERGIQ